jgi:hypothetical protein
VTVQLFPRVEINPASAAVSGVGTTLALSASAWDAAGNQIASPTVTWSSLNPNVATIDVATGVATAVASGQVTIAAEFNGVVGHALLTVSVPGVAPVTAWSAEALTDQPSWSLRDVWGVSPTEVYVVGGESILRYDGTRWTAMLDEAWMDAIWGASSSQVYGVQTRTVRHYDGTTWSETQIPRVGTHLMSLWGTSPNDIYAVGSFDPIMQYDGASWNSITELVPNLLVGIWGTSSNDIHMVGNRRPESGSILHYDGSELSVADVGAHLSAVWGTSSTDAYAVGWSGVILHWDGTDWTEMTSGTSVTLNGVWGTSPSDVYAVGDSGTILHYDGSGWGEMQSGISTNLYAVWGTSSGDVYAVGEGGVILRGRR